MSIYNLLKENIGKFDNWQMPSDQQLKLEFKVEHELKRNSFFNSEQDFLTRVKRAKVEEITPSDDAEIDYRSGTSSKSELLNLIRSYRSYPEFRNEDTIDAIYEGFANGAPMDYPIVLEFSNGARRVFSGNTRMDIAFQMNINPKVLIVQSDKDYY